VASPVIFTLGKYEIIGLLGQGGIAVVYRGYHREIDRYLAIKVLRPHYRLDPQFVERFKLEARVIARLQHPHIVPLYDYGSQDEVWFLATAYIQGGSLADLIADGPMPLPRIEKVLRQIASALDYAHRNGVIHRDIKPSNILIDSEGHALLADFGIVKIAGTGTTLTGTGGILGTPAYISPEQAEALAVDGRADIYSLGVVVFEMLTGQRPFHGRTPVEAMVLHASAPVPSATGLRPELPLAMDAVMLHVMAKKPGERYQTAVEFFEDFSRAIHSDVTFAQIKMALRPPVETAEHAQVRLDGLSPAPPTIIFDEAPPAIILLDDAPKPRLLPRSLKLAALAVIVLMAVILGRPTVPQNGPVGSLSFTVPGDTAQLEVLAMSPPAPGQHYVAWLQNMGDGSTALLGSLALDDSGAGSLTYTDPEGRLLLSLFDTLIITEETGDAASSPGTIHYTGHLPTSLTLALTEMLVKTSSLPETVTSTASYGPAVKPLNSLLDGAFAEATVGQMHTGLAARAPNLGAMYIHAEHTINIMLGTRDDYNGNGRGENPGRKIGVPFFLDHIDELLSAAVSDTPASAEIQGIMACNRNIRNWMNRVIALEHELLAASDIVSVEPQKTESTQLATFMLEGTDLDEDGQIELIEGECGLQQVSAAALRLASMPIIEEQH